MPTTDSQASRKETAVLSWGAVPVANGKVRFAIWAPGEDTVLLRLNGDDIAMNRLPGGWFETVTAAMQGQTYVFVLSDGTAVADPASRFQSGAVDGPSVIVDPDAYVWQSLEWQGRPFEETVVYELHLGTFTPEGTFRAAMAKLPHLSDLGITAVEILPVAQFRGDRGWGYDGVLLYAPHNAYGTPDDFKAFVDEAHRLGLMVFLDVVYNHFGPDGNMLGLYAPDFFHPEERTPWGAAIAYEKPPVRRFFIENAVYWLRDYRLDGLRFDAIDEIGDEDSDKHILVDIAETVRSALPGRHIHLATEDNRNVTFLHERDADGGIRHYSMEWNDDFHHAAHVIATGETVSYYRDFAHEPLAKLARALAEGFIYQGEPSPHADGKARGTPSAHLPPTAFLNFIQNHDQVGNRAFGERLRTLSDEATTKALMAILLLSPQIPLMFMGEEYGEVRNFNFFTDFDGNLADQVRNGRREEFSGLAGFDDDSVDDIPDPNDAATFEGSKLDWDRAESAQGREWLDFTRTLLSIRRDHVVPLLPRAGPHAGRIVSVDEGFLSVAWTFGAAHLHLVANMRNDTVTTHLPHGRLLYDGNGGSAARVTGEIGAKSVVLILDDDTRS